MDIRVSGHQLDTGAALRTHVETRLNAIKDKCFFDVVCNEVKDGFLALIFALERVDERDG